MADLDLSMIAKLLTTAQLAAKKECDQSAIRRAAKAGDLPSYDILGRKGFDPEDETVINWVPPEGSSRAVREDGRKRYIIYLNDDEVAAVNAAYVGDDGNPLLQDPRIAAKARRAARKAAKEAAGDTDEADDDDDEMFEDFGA